MIINSVLTLVKKTAQFLKELKTVKQNAIQKINVRTMHMSMKKKDGINAKMKNVPMVILYKIKYVFVNVNILLIKMVEIV